MVSAVTGAAPFFWIMIPSTPVHSAVLMIAPKLRTSESWSSNRKRGVVLVSNVFSTNSSTVLCKPVQFFNGDIGRANTVFADQRFHIPGKIALKAFLDKNLVYGFIGFYSFNYSPDAIDLFCVLHGVKVNKKTTLFRVVFTSKLWLPTYSAQRITVKGPPADSPTPDSNRSSSFGP